jgi:hypothetical protein
MYGSYSKSCKLIFSIFPKHGAYHPVKGLSILQESLKEGG